MVNPPSSLRLLLDSLLEGRRGEKKQFLMQMNKELPGNQLPTPLYLLLISQRKISGSPSSSSVSEKVHHLYLYIHLEYSMGLVTIPLLSKALIL